MKHYLILLIIYYLIVNLNVSAQNFWEQTSGPYDGTVYTIVKNSNGYLFAGTYRGIYRSTEDGEHWTTANEGLTDLRIESMAVNISGHIFAGTHPGLFRSTDNGQTWNHIDYGTLATSTQALLINPH